jgi:hypothetical protein
MKCPKRGLLRLFERGILEMARMSAHTEHMWAAAAAFTCAETARLQSHEMLPWESQVTTTKWTSSPQMASLRSLAVSHSTADPSVCQLCSGRWRHYRDVDRNCSTNLRSPCLSLRVFVTAIYLLLPSKRGTAIAQSVQRLAKGWTVRGSNPGGGEIFRTCPNRPWGPPSLLCNEFRVLPGCKTAEAWRWPPSPSSAEVKERVELYLYSPSGSSWPILGWPLPLPFTFEKKSFCGHLAVILNV